MSQADCRHVVKQTTTDTSRCEHSCRNKIKSFSVDHHAVLNYCSNYLTSLSDYANEPLGECSCKKYMSQKWCSNGLWYAQPHKISRKTLATHQCRCCSFVYTTNATLTIQLLCTVNWTSILSSAAWLLNLHKHVDIGQFKTHILVFLYHTASALRYPWRDRVTAIQFRHYYFMCYVTCIKRTLKYSHLLTLLTKIIRHY